jgi:hypothetical protein
MEVTRDRVTRRHDPFGWYARSSRSETSTPSRQDVARRPIRLAYCIGLLLWTLSGSDDLEWSRDYNVRASKVSDDGGHLHGVFGKRL